MLNVQGSANRLCDGLSRRNFLRVGALGSLGLSLPTLLRAAGSSAAGTGFGRAKRCIMLYLTGGPSQLDTFDLKPDAPAEIRGEFRPIPTNVPGIRIGEHFPRLARHADKCCLVRSVSHRDAVHTSAGYSLLTGEAYPRMVKSATEVRPGPHDRPHVGSLVAKARAGGGELPAFVALPETIKDAGVNEFPGQDGGFMGKKWSPFRVDADSRHSRLLLPDIYLRPGMTGARLSERGALLDQLNRSFAAADAAGRLDALDAYRRRAVEMIVSPSARRAFELDREADKVRDAYGEHLFGQGCLLARRLVQAGVSLVTVYWHYEGPDDSPVWDSHWNNFEHLKNRLMPPTDRAIAALLEDLAGRGLLDDTLVTVAGEFGRTPKINNKAGRDHWPHVFSVLLAGGGVRAGTAYGASDRLGAYPHEAAVYPPDLIATVLHLLGVPRDMELRDQTDRPFSAYVGSPVRGLIG
jgi:hypothetical protein